MSITLNTKVYNWAQFDPSGTSRYQETSAGIPTGYSPLTNKVTSNPGTGKSSKVQWRIAVPVIALVDGATWKAGDIIETDYVDLIYSIANQSTLTIRQDLRLRLASLVANAQYIASVDNLVQATG